MFLYPTTRTLSPVPSSSSAIMLRAEISNRSAKNHAGEKTMEVALDTRKMFSLRMKSLDKYQLIDCKIPVNSISLHISLISL